MLSHSDVRYHLPRRPLGLREETGPFARDSQYTFRHTPAFFQRPHRTEIRTRPPHYTYFDQVAQAPKSSLIFLLEGGIKFVSHQHLAFNLEHNLNVK